MKSNGTSTRLASLAAAPTFWICRVANSAGGGRVERKGIPAEVGVVPGEPAARGIPDEVRSNKGAARRAGTGTAAAWTCRRRPGSARRRGRRRRRSPPAGRRTSRRTWWGSRRRPVRGRARRPPRRRRCILRSWRTRCAGISASRFPCERRRSASRSSIWRGSVHTWVVTSAPSKSARCMNAPKLRPMPIGSTIVNRTWPGGRLVSSRNIDCLKHRQGRVRDPRRASRSAGWHRRGTAAGPESRTTLARLPSIGRRLEMPPGRAASSHGNRARSGSPAGPPAAATASGPCRVIPGGAVGGRPRD